MCFGPLVSAEWLDEHLRDPDVRVIDFRWYLLDRNGRDEHSRGHISGAVFVDLESVTGAPSKTNRGRHPLPANWQLQDEMQKADGEDITKVVVYDDPGVSVAPALRVLPGRAA